MTATPALYTILDPSATPLIRLVQHPNTTVLQIYGSAGSAELELDPATMQLLLRALPRRTLLTALDMHEDCPECFVCQVCTGCDCPAEGLDTPTYYTPAWDATAPYRCQHCDSLSVQHHRTPVGPWRCPARAAGADTPPLHQPCTALHMACPTCGSEAYPCGCLTEATPLTLDLDTLPDDEPLPIAILLYEPPIPPAAPWFRQPGSVGDTPTGGGVAHG